MFATVILAAGGVCKLFSIWLLTFPSSVKNIDHKIYIEIVIIKNYLVLAHMHACMHFVLGNVCLQQ